MYQERSKDFRSLLHHYASKSLHPDTFEYHRASIHLMQTLGMQPPTQFEYDQLCAQGELARQQYIDKRHNQNLPNPHSNDSHSRHAHINHTALV